MTSGLARRCGDPLSLSFDGGGEALPMVTPTDSPSGWLGLTPRRIQVWREVNATFDRELMRDGRRFV